MYSGVAQYRNVQAKTTDPRSVLIMLYEKTIQQISLAITTLVDGNDAIAHRVPLMKAQLGVLELDRTLNWQHMPQLAESLHNLYMHILLQLNEGFSQGNIEALRSAENFLLELRNTWKEAIANDQRIEMPRAKAV